MSVDTREIYLSELIHEEKALEEMANNLRVATAKFRVASEKYAAVRDMVNTTLIQSPYARDFEWPPNLLDRIGPGDGKGKFRFIHMAYGEAITTVLGEKGAPLTTPRIIATLLNGGFGMGNDGEPVVQARSLNAALMKTSGIVKHDDDTYSYEAESVGDAEDLPW